MTTLLETAKSNYLLQAGQDQLHHDATEWLSELEFCKTELSFFSKLLDKTFLRVNDKNVISELLLLERKIKLLMSIRLSDLQDKMILHERNLASLDENVFSKIKQSIHEEHEARSYELKTLVESVKKIKTELFELVEKQMAQK